MARFTLDPPIVHVCTQPRPDVAFFSTCMMAAWTKALGRLRLQHDVQIYAFSFLPRFSHVVLQAANVKAAQRFAGDLFETIEDVRFCDGIPVSPKGHRYPGKAAPLRSKRAFLRQCHHIEQLAYEHGYAPRASAWQFSSLWVRRFTPIAYRDSILTPWPMGSRSAPAEKGDTNCCRSRLGQASALVGYLE